MRYYMAYNVNKNSGRVFKVRPPYINVHLRCGYGVIYEISQSGYDLGKNQKFDSKTALEILKATWPA